MDLDVSNFEYLFWFFHQRLPVDSNKYNIQNFDNELPRTLAKFF